MSSPDSVLTKSEQKIMDFIHAHRETACYLTVTELAEAAKVSNTTVLRLTKKMGYDRFPEFRANLQDQMMHINSRNASVLTSTELLQDIRDKDWRLIIDECKTNFLQHASKIFVDNTYEELNRVADWMINARKVVISGFLLAESMALHSTRMLRFSRGNVTALVDPQSISEIMYDLDCQDLVLVFSYPRYSKNVRLTVDAARRHGSRLVLVTDHTVSSVTEHADSVLISDRVSNSYFNSYVGVICIIEVLMALISGKTFHETEERLEDREAFLRQNEQY